MRFGRPLLLALVLLVLWRFRLPPQPSRRSLSSTEAVGSSPRPARRAHAPDPSRREPTAPAQAGRTLARRRPSRSATSAPCTPRRAPARAASTAPGSSCTCTAASGIGLPDNSAMLWGVGRPVARNDLQARRSGLLQRPLPRGDLHRAADASCIRRTPATSSKISRLSESSLPEDLLRGPPAVSAGVEPAPARSRTALGSLGFSAREATRHAYRPALSSPRRPPPSRAAAASPAEPGQISSKRAEARARARPDRRDRTWSSTAPWRITTARPSSSRRSTGIWPRTRKRLVTARADLAEARKRVANRVPRALHLAGARRTRRPPGASSLGDLIERIDSVNRISKDDARIAAEVTRFRDEVRTSPAAPRAGPGASSARSWPSAPPAGRRSRASSQSARRCSRRSRTRSRSSRRPSGARQGRSPARPAAQLRSTQTPDLGPARVVSPPPSDPTRPPSPSPSPPPASPSPPSTHGGVVGIALRYLGVPYRWGGASPSGLRLLRLPSCASSPRSAGTLPHSSYMQFRLGRFVAAQRRSSPETRSSSTAPRDVGIYIGSGRFVHAPHTGDVVKISNLGDAWYSSTYVGARRY